MSVSSTAELLAFLREHDFLTPSQLRSLGGIVEDSGDGRALAGLLVKRNWLTPYQANLLLQGRGEGLILGPYLILDRLGEGGMGQVFKARHARMDRVVAIKIIPRDRVNNPVALGRFHREVRAVARMSHPNIVTAFEANQVGQTHYLAMEFVNGIDLARLVEQSGPLPIANACDYIRQAALGLQHAHEHGLVHRDVKPGNLIVARRGPDEPPAVKILDFGLARIEDEVREGTRLTQLGKIVGTVDYMAPEQVDNAQKADIRADVYSLGCSLFYLLTGTPPFPGEDAITKLSARVMGEALSVRKSRADISPALDGIVAKMMARYARDRYQTPGEVAEALGTHTARASTVVSTPPPIRNVPGPRSIRAATPRTRQGSVTATSADSPFPEAIIVPSGVPTPAKRRGPLVAALVASSAVVLTCLGVIPLVVPELSTRPDPPAPVPREKDIPEPLKANSKPDPVITNSVGMRLVWIPAGEFTMGSDDPDAADDEKPPHRVTVSRAYYLGQYEVTVGQFKHFVDATGFQTEAEVKGDAKTWLDPGFQQKDDHPVVCVSWHDAQRFCKWLSKKEGKTYRLPYECEWEHACRAGTKTEFHFGDDDAQLGEHAWYKANSGDHTHPVGQKKPNPWQLYDIYGNVGEWCQDGLRTYDTQSVIDPRGPMTFGVIRTRRSGHWDGPPAGCRSGCRGNHPPTDRRPQVGFRIVFAPMGAKADDEPPGEVWRFDGHTNHVRRLAISEKGNFLLSACWDYHVRLFEVDSDRMLHQFKPLGEARVHGAAFLPDGRGAVFGGDPKVVKVWALDPPNELFTLSGHERYVGYVAVSPDGHRAASCGPEPTVYVWDLTDKRLLRRLEGHTEGVNSVAFSPKGDLLAVAANDRRIHIWKVESGELVAQLAGHEKPVGCVRFGADGREILSGGGRTVRLWNIENEKEVKKCQVTGGQVVYTVALSQNGRWALSGGTDRVIRLWDLESGEERHRFTGHTDLVWDVLFSPDGRYALSCGGDNTVRMWRLPPLE